MYNPNDDPDVTSGLQDDAKKEMTTPGTSDPLDTYVLLSSTYRGPVPRTRACISMPSSPVVS